MGLPAFSHHVNLFCLRTIPSEGGALDEAACLLQLKLTLLLTAVAVPINTLVGVVAAINITRSEFPGKTLMVAMLDLPFSISPVVTGADSLPHAWTMGVPLQLYLQCGAGAGLMLVLLYGREGWFAPILRATNFNIVFAFPGAAHLTCC